MRAGGQSRVTDVPDDIAGIGIGGTIVATIVSAIVAFASIAWLLKLVAHHQLTVFVWYRVPAGILLAILLAAGAISAT